MTELAINLLFLAIWIPYTILILYEMNHGQTFVGVFRIKRENRPKLFWAFTFFQFAMLCFGWSVWLYGTWNGWT